MFHRGASALSAVRPDISGLYGCPLCLRAFPIEALAANVLTEEHAPPRSRGGDVVCLTCSECNHTAGMELDCHVEVSETLLDFVRRQDTRPIRGRFGVNGVMQRGEISMKDGRLQMIGVPKRDRPGTKEQIIAAFDQIVDSENEPPAEINLTFEETFSDRRATIGWLRSAYLVAFATFGYRYVLRPDLDVIRRQIREPDAETIRPPVALDATADVTRRVIFLATAPTELSGVHVILGRRSVVLPDVDPDPSYIERVEALQHRTEKVSHLHGKLIEWTTTARFMLDQPLAA